MFKIAVITSTRAEYGLLYPLIKKIDADPDLELLLYVTGGHLSEKQGLTVHAIEEDGIPIKKRVPILDPDNGPQGISKTMANALIGFADCFAADRPDLAVILGDRTEMLGVAAAAVNERIPIAHIHGGEVTEGAVDDCVRHAISKMSFLHFTANEAYRKRVIQLGEDPERVFFTGALGVENILCMKPLDEDELRDGIGLPQNGPFAVVTFHPVTLEGSPIEAQVEGLCGVIKDRDDISWVITGANADAGGDRINEIFAKLSDTRNNVLFVHNLGTRRYLSAIKYAAFVLGNSSSGILEAPVLGTPSINVGDRQKGRIKAETVIDCTLEKGSLEEAIDKALLLDHMPSKLFGDGQTSEQIVKTIKARLEQCIDLKKSFYDLQV